MAELTGPNNCAECGTDTPIEVLQAGDAGALVIAIDGDMVEVPGLYVCTNCAGAIMVGEREATVTPERAVEFLTDTYAGLLAMYMTAAYNEYISARRRFNDVKAAAEKLDPNTQIELGVIPLED